MRYAVYVYCRKGNSILNNNSNTKCIKIKYIIHHSSFHIQNKQRGIFFLALEKRIAHNIFGWTRGDYFNFFCIWSFFLLFFSLDLTIWFDFTLIMAAHHFVVIDEKGKKSIRMISILYAKRKKILKSKSKTKTEKVTEIEEVKKKTSNVQNEKKGRKSRTRAHTHRKNAKSKLWNPNAIICKPSHHITDSFHLTVMITLR